VANQCHLIDGDYLEMSYCNANVKKICRISESFSYQKIITDGANMWPVKACAPRWTFCFISANR